MSGAQAVTVPETDAPTPAPANGAPKKRWFRPASGPQLSADAAKREGRIVRLALDRLGAAATPAFLNGFDASLDGRPLAVAARSDEGAAAVERLIETLRSSD